MYKRQIQTHVRIISIICLIANGLIWLNIINISITGYVSDVLNIFFNNDFLLAIIVQICVFLVQLVVYILCFIATFKRNKFMLFPFLVVTIIQILFIIGFAIYFTYLASIGIGIIENFSESKFFSSFGIMVFIFIFVVPVVAVIAVLLYFIIIVSKFYQEIEDGGDSMDPPRIVVQQCPPNITLPELQPAGVQYPINPSYEPSAPIETFQIENPAEYNAQLNCTTKQQENK